MPLNGAMNEHSLALLLILVYSAMNGIFAAIAPKRWLDSPWTTTRGLRHLRGQPEEELGIIRFVGGFLLAITVAAALVFFGW